MDYPFVKEEEQPNSEWSANQRKGISMALKAAVGHLRVSDRDAVAGCQHICYALDHAARANPYLMYHADDARTVIRNRLGRHTTVDAWLMNELKVPIEQLVIENLQAYRHRWLQALIEEFSN